MLPSQPKNYFDSLIAMLSNWTYILLIPVIYLGIEDYALCFNRKDISYFNNLDYSLPSILRALVICVCIGIGIILLQFIFCFIVLFIDRYYSILPKKEYGRTHNYFLKSQLLEYSIEQKNSVTFALWTAIDNKDKSKKLNGKLSFFLLFFLIVNGIVGSLYDIKSFMISVISYHPNMWWPIGFVIMILFKISVLDYFEDDNNCTNIRYPEDYEPQDFLSIKKKSTNQT